MKAFTMMDRDVLTMILKNEFYRRTADQAFNVSTRILNGGRP